MVGVVVEVEGPGTGPLIKPQVTTEVGSPDMEWDQIRVQNFVVWDLHRVIDI